MNIEQSLTEQAKLNGKSRSIAVVLTIDVEPDNAWENHQNTSVANVRELLRLQKLLDEYGAPPTCLVTYRVLQDAQAVATLEELVNNGGAEIGAHLHPWETPPFMKSGLDVKYQTYPHELPLAVFEKKISILTAAITERFDKPTSYRAGRWGLAAEHLSVLENAGYETDTSVTPLNDWRPNMGLPRSQNGNGGIDYLSAPRHPYHLDHANVCRPGNASIVEIPVSVAFTRRIPSVIRHKYDVLSIVLRRALRKFDIIKPVWATPALESADDLSRMIAVAIAEGTPVFNIMLHSSELAKNTSPYTQTQADVDTIFDRIEMMLKLLASDGRCVFTTLTDAMGRWKADQLRVSGDLTGKHAGRKDPTLTIRSKANPKPSDNVEQEHDKTKLAYVLAASHSGSTLLTMLLGSHTDTCTVGELKATNLGNVDSYRCSCGEPIKQCRFWLKVAKEMAGREIPFDITNADTDIHSGGSRYTRLLLKPLHRGMLLERVRDAGLWLSPVWRARLPRIKEVNSALVASVCRITGKRMIIDSSKTALRLKYLLRNPRLDVKVIRLIRDGRAVALTYMDPTTYANASDPTVRVRRVTRRLSMAEAAHCWRRSNEEADLLLAGIDASRWKDVRYEEYCNNPKETLSKLFSFLGLCPSKAIDDFRSVEHHVIGNAMRLDRTSEIRLDERWKSVLTAEDLKTFDRVAGDLNRRYGYH